MTKNVSSVLGEGQAVVKELTGIDINQLLTGLAQKQGAGSDRSVADDRSVANGH
ncbi:hypothetical protein Q6350_03110 [Isoptericola sp. b515]|uniref:hypothetical protein n=1 Tax=Isoptericola sp. b515 TaxID=3064652 RepID=UPI002714138F|nr:hypothetical protein [Isoptericola sp. b515]MDO8147413.1 hypothetical protein [Isoptericola sp. b515]